jgi:hypothetical protein
VTSHRDDRKCGRNILPFAGKAATTPDPDAPRPIFEYGKLFLVNGRPYQAMGERWKTEEAHHAIARTEPDCQNPGVSLTLYLKDVLTGDVIRPVSFEEFSAAVDRLCQAQAPLGRAADPATGP